MRKLVVVGFAGAAFAAAFAGVASASDEIVTASVTIELASEATGYATAGATRAIDLVGIANEAIIAPKLETTGPVVAHKPIVPAAPAQEQVASAATAAAPAAAVAPVTAALPDFASSKAVSSDVAPAKRKVVKVAMRVERKRVSLPMPVTLGAFR